MRFRNSRKTGFGRLRGSFRKPDFEGIRMHPMGSLRVQHGDDWIAAKATIVATRKRLLPWKYGGAMDYPLPEYVVTFSYSVGDRELTGKYVTTSPQERGHTFNIFYDPEHPDRNTGLDEPVNPW